MAPAFKSITPANSAGAVTQLAITVPAVANGDAMLFAVAIRGGSNVTGLTLNNWTPVFETNQGTNNKLAVFSRVARNEPASYTLTWTTAGTAAGAILVASGTAPASLVDVSGAQGNASSVSVTAPSVATTTDGCLLVFLGGCAGATATTWTAPNGMTERADVGSTGGAPNISFTAAEQLLGAAGATGTRVATVATAGQNSGGLVALRAASGLAYGQISLALTTGTANSAAVVTPTEGSLAVTTGALPTEE